MTCYTYVMNTASTTIRRWDIYLVNGIRYEVIGYDQEVAEVMCVEVSNPDKVVYIDRSQLTELVK